MYLCKKKKKQLGEYQLEFFPMTPILYPYLLHENIKK